MDNTEQKFGKGAVVDTIDKRDYDWSEIGGAKPFDWEKGFDIEQKLGFTIPVKDQNGSLSCGGQAWAYYMQVLEAIETGSFEERSAKYIYAQTNLPGGGSAGRDNCDVCIKQGVAIESLCPSYEANMPPNEQFMIKSSDITDDAKTNAKLAKSKLYANVRNDIESFATAIEANNGLIMLITGENNGTWTSVFPQPPASTNYQNMWNHWLYIGKAKLINGKKYIGVLNSWGAGVGENGWQWISEDYFQKYIYYGWTLSIKKFESTTKPKHKFVNPLVLGVNNNDVKALQDILKYEKLFPSNVDSTGYYGNITAKAVYEWQVKHNVASLSELDSLKGRRCGQKTINKLNELYG